MIWLAWRQHRKQLLITILALAALAGLMIPTGLAMRATFDSEGLDDCVRGLDYGDSMSSVAANCDAAFARFGDQYETMSLLAVLFLVVPVFVGLFWGAPLVAREVEHGTHRFVWTQGIGRRRWAVVKLGLAGAVAVGVSVIYGLLMTWWLEPLGRVGDLSRFRAMIFDLQGVTPIAYTLFAVALGVFAGTLWPRVIPAMGATLAVFAGVRIAVTVLARPRFQPAETREFPVIGAGPEQRNGNMGDWILDAGVRNPDGKTIMSGGFVGCRPEGTRPDGQTCGADIGMQPGAVNFMEYQPADRFWLFQFIEGGIFVVLAAVLFYLAVRRVRRIA